MRHSRSNKTTRTLQTFLLKFIKFTKLGKIIEVIWKQMRVFQFQATCLILKKTLTGEGRGCLLEQGDGTFLWKYRWLVPSRLYYAHIAGSRVVWRDDGELEVTYLALPYRTPYKRRSWKTRDIRYFYLTRSPQHVASNSHTRPMSRRVYFSICFRALFLARTETPLRLYERIRNIRYQKETKGKINHFKVCRVCWQAG